MNSLPKRILPACLLILFSTFSLSLQADALSDKKKVEREIKKISTEIGKKKEESSYLNSQVSKLEQELGELTRQQHETEKKIEAAQARIRDADIEKTELNDKLKLQQTALAQQLQAMHTAGEQSHLRLLLLQDKPADISRNIQYFNILNKHRAKKIKEINETSSKLEAVTKLAAQERTELKGLDEQLALQKQEVEKKLVSREQALKAVNSELSSKEKRFRQLKDQENALQKEIDRITRAAEQRRRAANAQREAEAARRTEAQRQEAARLTEQKRRQQQTQAAAQKPQPAPAAPQAAKPVVKATGKQVTTTKTPNQPFSRMRGKLSWPVNGRVLYNYGSRRNEKQHWKGIVIEAPGGASVKSIAPGTVVFAGWMEGYGHLIIIEHDRNYLSLYGYNRAVFKRVGQRVNANESIAAVGNSSGQARNALYFEIRKNSAPQNPASWLRK
ncbi:MAG: peptidoglycan DD-metalloendopeptidase family protein [Thiolinea sp.]